MGATCSVYVAEVTRPEDRGLFSLFGPTFTALGVLIISLLGFTVHWKTAAMICSACCLIGCFLLKFIPETPSWLNKKGHDSQCVDAMIWFRGLTYELDDYNIKMDDSNTSNFFKDLIKTKSWKPFLIMIIFFTLQSGSGLYEIVYYPMDFIGKSGSYIKPQVVAILLAAMRFITCAIGSLVIQKYNRCVMLFISATGMAITMLLSGLYEFLYEKEDIKERPFNFLPQFLILLNISFSMFGVHQLPWSLSGELFPFSVRGVMNGITSSFGCIFIFATVKIYPWLFDKIRLFGSMWLFAGFSFVTILFSKYVLPETKGKTLKEIELIFNKRTKPCSNEFRKS